MRWLVVSAIGLAFPVSGVSAENFATCLLDELPGIQSDIAAYSVRKVCATKYPGMLDAVEQGSGRGWFGYGSGAECIAKKAAKTPSRVAAGMITAACNKLYDAPRYLSDKEVFG